MMQKYSLKAEDRKITGRKVKNLRNEGMLPANIYGKGIKSQAVKTELSEFTKIFSEAGETGLVELSVGSKKLPILIHNVQVDPVDSSYLHADFYQVNLKEKVVAQVPLELVGESPAVKLGLGTVVQYTDEIEVEALPTDLPDKFEINIDKLKEVDQTISIKDLVVDKNKIEIKAEPEQILVKVEPQREEEVEPEPVATESEAEVDQKLDAGEEVKKEESSAEGGNASGEDKDNSKK
jgi:large subunit ribosomal protein L25